ncbi:HlyD family secretion protein [Candidatus Electronema sp. TJ]|uniref:HlyD family secretion protein n=1 Tax=Candidatus Electronema sp. TJ TaxID=3401573 RepID=UPI003AA8BD4A
MFRQNGSILPELLLARRKTALQDMLLLFCETTRLRSAMKLSACLLFSCLLLAACKSSPQRKVALGTLERDRISHAAAASEVIAEQPLPQGSMVKKGAVLVRLNDTLQKMQVSKAKAELAQAAANLDRLRNGARAEEIAAAKAKVTAAQAVLTESEVQHERLSGLARQNITSKGEMDKAASARDVARAHLQAAQEELRILTNGTRAEDLQAATAKLEAAAAVLAMEKKRLADLTITAACDGLLDELPWKTGERPAAGSALAVLLAGKAPYARVYVPEPYRAKIKTGDKLTVHVDGMEVPVTGQVRWIAAEAAFTPYYALNQEERARLMFLAEVQLPDSQSHLPDGVPAQVDLP